MKTLFPNRNQWSQWSLPSKLTAISCYIGIIAFILAPVFYFFPKGNDTPVTATDISEIIRSQINDLYNQLNIAPIESSEEYPGFSLHIIAMLYRVATADREYIFEVGAIGKSRLSVYLDSDNNLCMRVIDRQGESFTLKVKSDYSTFLFEEMGWYSFEIADKGSTFQLAIRVNGSVVASQTFEFPLQILPLELDDGVMGADLEGHKGAKINIAEVIVFSNTLSAKNMRIMLNNFIRKERPSWISFNRHQWMRINNENKRLAEQTDLQFAPTYHNGGKN